MPEPGDQPQQDDSRRERASAMAVVFRLAAFLGIGLAAVAGVYTAYWLIIANQVERGIHVWIEDQAASGLSIRYRDLTVEGFPLWIDVHATDLSALVERGSQAFEWKGPTVIASARPWNLRRIQFDMPGVHDIVGQPSVALTAKVMGGDVLLEDRGAWRFNLVVGGLDGQVSNLGAFQAKHLDADFIWAGRLAPGSETPPARIDLGASDVIVPERRKTPLGRQFQSLRLVAHVTGPIGELRDPAVLKTWRNQGGSIEITRFAVRHGPLNVTSTGTAALDLALQPIGAFNVRAEGYMDTVDALRSAGVIGAGDATAAKLVLAVLAKRPVGQTPYIEAPLTLQDRRLTLETLKIAKLPRLDWSELSGGLVSGD